MVREKVYTLAFIKRDDDVLLGRKTRGIGKGLWNGFGGKVETNESILEAAQREIKEECGVEVNDLKRIGCMIYEDEDEVAIVHVFTGMQMRGIPEASDEMNPVQWYHRKDLGDLRMFDDFRDWKEFVFGDKFFCGRIKYYNQRKVVGDKLIKKCDSLREVLDCLEHRFFDLEHSWQ